MEDPPLAPGSPCACGLNWSEIYADDFACGHEQTALHQRIAQIGTITDFLRWFDAVRGGAEPAATSAPFAGARLTGQFKLSVGDDGSVNIKLTPS